MRRGRAQERPASAQTAKDKTGVFTGAYAINPVNGEEIPIWIADYVLMGYGTGAIMAVPGHDERDFEFAQTFDLPIVAGGRAAGRHGVDHGGLEMAFVEEGIADQLAATTTASPTAEVKARIIADLEARGVGKRRVNYKLRDWLFSPPALLGRAHPVYFPVETEGDPCRGDAHRSATTSPSRSSRASCRSGCPSSRTSSRRGPGRSRWRAPWTGAIFQKDGRWPARETNTMPQWAGSCWYYLRFTRPAQRRGGLVDGGRQAVDAGGPVRGRRRARGAAPALRPLLAQGALRRGLVPSAEPFAKLVHQGMILGEVEYTKYVDTAARVVSRTDVDEKANPPTDTRSGLAVQPVRLAESEVEKNKKGDFVLTEHPEVVVEARAHKMSKSRGNVVNPDAIVEQFGADAMRVYEMFMGPLEATKPWSTQGLSGMRRFLDRVWDLTMRAEKDAPVDEALARLLHRTIRTVTEHIEQMRFNTAISAMMVLTNDITRRKVVPASVMEPFVQLLHPFAPHLGEELWEQLGHAPSIQNAPWPRYDPALCETDEVDVPVQVNGKLRGKVRLGKDATEADALEAAKADANVAAHLEGRTLKKTVWVPGKILNLIAG